MVKVLAQLVHLYRIRALIFLVLSVSLSMMDAVGLTVLLTLLTDQEISNIPFALDSSDWFSYFLLIVLFVVKSILLYFSNFTLLSIQLREVNRLRDVVIDNYFIYEDIGITFSDALNQFTFESDRLIRNVKNTLSIFRFTLMIATYLVLAFNVNWSASLILIGIGLLVQGFFLNLYRRIKSNGMHLSDKNRETLESIDGYLRLRRYGLATDRLQEIILSLRKMFSAWNESFKKAQYAIFKAQSIREPSVVLTLMAGVFVIKIFDLSTGEELLLILGILFRVMSTTSSLQNEIVNFQNTSSVHSLFHSIHRVKNNRLRTEDSEITVQGHIRRGDSLLQYDTCLTLQGLTYITGPSGCGKSTLFLLVCDAIYHGQGLCVSAPSMRVGYVEQEPRLFDADYFEIESLIETHQELAEKFRIPSFFNSSKGMEEYSGGQLARLVTFIELCRDVDVIFIDEADGALSGDIKEGYLRTLHESGKSIFLISHSPVDEYSRISI